ncbi:hypothetical protein F4553_004548 [Allocatelliglobosispora scoriae]|uniref:Uncharacterized protein n=1 Tax=Allocatelliglobosispora scoriae TaxID=643052 RepID=A0A841BVI3_9ACTN|nr:hypothetical protein [Allocatelliglobosispora scoriae]MBB5871169.1 hypothetical protein [Allocatelliglobosispora scoriae]
MSTIFRALTLFTLFTAGLAGTTSAASAEPTAPVPGASAPVAPAPPAPPVDPVPDPAAPPVAPGAVVMPDDVNPEPVERVVSTQPLAMPTFDGEVMALATKGNILYVGGAFTHAYVGGKSVARTRLAAINVATGVLLPWKPTADAPVRALAANEAAVFIAGEFATINGTKRDSLAAVDPTSGSNKVFSHKISGHPKTLALTSQRLYLGGSVTSVDGVVVQGAAAFDLSNGALAKGWAPKPNKSNVNSIVIGSGGVYLGGSFTNVGSVAGTKSLALVDPATGAAKAGFTPDIAYNVNGLTLNGDKVYAAVAGPGGRIMSVNAANGDAAWTVTTDGDVQAVAVLDSVIYFGGHYDRVCKTSSVGDKGFCNDGSDIRIKIAAVNMAGKLLGWNANANGVKGVTALISSPGLGIVAAGGTFTQVNGKPQQRLVIFGP